ncbi:MAG: CvpA family protein [Alphaproteobacteria bacterium]|nr:CvpA family protein [Alphaproteobacteria bacterium]
MYGVDVFILAVVLLSGILSFSRGFTGEMLGVGAWILSGVVGFYAMPILEPMVLKYVDKPILANLISMTIVSIFVLVITTIVFNKITGKIRDSKLNRFDKFLGFVFGGVRGVIILVLIYFLIMTLAPKDLEKMQKESKLFVYLEQITTSVKKQLPESLFDNPARGLGKNSIEQDQLDKLIEKLNKDSKSKKTNKKTDKKAGKDKQAEKTKLIDAVMKGEKFNPKDYSKEDLEELFDQLEENEDIKMGLDAIKEKLNSSNINDILDGNKEKIYETLGISEEDVKNGLENLEPSMFEKLNNPKVETKKSKGDSGYNKKERDELEQLIMQSEE